ncbi:uncharacterized protein m isoform X2 [Planococcus citri]|uniref:uncharacterized protein m isoform X2 n=1 Tax=Planococcus citri TaxID=170843 RepID=UPI0031F89C94
MDNLSPETKPKPRSHQRLKRPTMSLILVATIGSIWIFMDGVASASNDVWPLERPDGMPAIQSLEVMCGKDHMDVHLQFTQPFEGIVSSKGQYGDPRCIYVPPSTGKTYYTFRIAYARCGTKPDLNGQFYENTVVVQYDKDLLEVWDEAKRLRCEWYNDYEKTASKPPMVIADLDVIQLDFRGDNVDCWMEIQHGKGPWAPPVSGIVPLGSTLTLVVAINDYRGEFDMRVKSCAASDGAGHIIQLSDEHGCVLRPKMISRFAKAKIHDERASVITYAFFHAFKFPDALSVHIKCKVEICRHGCLDHCQLADSIEPVGLHQGAFDEYNTIERKDSSQPNPKDSPPKRQSAPSNSLANDLYDDKSVEDIPNEAAYDDQNPAPLKGEPPVPSKPEVGSLPVSGVREVIDTSPPPPPILHNVQMPQMSNNMQPRRRRRSFVVSDSKAKNANVGVSGLYEVISEADLAFTPDNKQEAVTVFQGKIREEVVYGICLPVQGFSVIFILMALCAILSAIVAGFLLYRYQIQRQKQKILQHQQRMRHQQQQYASHIFQTSGGAAGLAVNSLANWMALRLIGNRLPQAEVSPQRQTGSNHKS